MALANANLCFQAYVKSFYLHHEGLDTTLYVQRLEPDNRTTILSSNNFFERQIDTHVLFRGAAEFEYREGFLFVTKEAAKDLDGNEEDEDHIDLLISAGGERFVHADFGMDDLPNLDYHIVDVTTEGQVGDSVELRFMWPFFELAFLQLLELLSSSSSGLYSFCP